MFQYIKKSMWFPTSIDFGQAATIEELLKLCKQGEVERVVIPMTYYGYGASLIDISNSRSIERHYRKARFKNHGYSLTMSASQFIRNEHYRELIEELQEQYPVFDDQDYSELEYETKLEFIVAEIESVLDSKELRIAGGTTAYWTKHYVQEILEHRPNNFRAMGLEEIDWLEEVIIDTDGITVYAEKESIERLALEVQALSIKLWGKETK